MIGPRVRPGRPRRRPAKLHADKGYDFARYERRADILRGLLHLACAPSCARKL